MSEQGTKLSLSPVEIARAEQIWAEYQAAHDLSPYRGWTAGIDPQTKRVWLAASLAELSQQRKSTGDMALLHFVRVGASTYFVKGAKR
ncbi:hypothetical protein GC163_04370 [bacterium]|nr:hypothetical protein [bacterium]